MLKDAELASWMDSKWLMQRISVDLPEPEGPQTTTISPVCTEKLMSLRAWYSPYHLFTPLNSTTIFFSFKAANF